MKIPTVQLHVFNQLLATITAFLTIFYSGIWRGYLAIVISKFRSEEVPFPIDADDLSWMVALTDFGGLFSPFPIAYLMDRFGRLFVLRFAFTFFISGTALILSATSSYHIFLGSFLIGLGRGIGFTTSPLYVAEIATAKFRGALSSMNSLMLVGAAAVTFTFGPNIPFKHLTRAILVCPLTGLLLTFFIAESPYFYVIQNDEKFAFNALSRFRDSKKITENDVELEFIHTKVENKMQGKRNWSDLISEKNNRKALIIVVVKGALQRAGGWNSILTYSPAILPANSGWNPNKSVLISLWMTVIFSLLKLILVDRLGRKPLQIVGTLVLFLITAISAVFFYFYQNTNVDTSLFTFVPHAGLILGGMFYPFGISVNIYRGELLSMSIKGRVSAIVSTVQLAISFIINKIFLAVDQSVGVFLLYAMFSTFYLVNVIFTAVYIFETKGKTLAEIQDILNR